MSAIAGSGHFRSGNSGGSHVSASLHGGSVSGSTHGGGGGFLSSSVHGTGKALRGGLGLGKRGTITSLIGGGTDPLASVFSLKSMGAVAPEKALAASYGKIASFSLLQHPYFASGCYLLSAKGNTFGIVQVSMLGLKTACFGRPCTLKALFLMHGDVLILHAGQGQWEQR